jgi:hypothetical protein
VPKFIEKKLWFGSMYNNLFGRDPERSMECNFLFIFSQSQLQSDIILFPRIRSSWGDQFQRMVAGASTSER